jgi:transposase
VCVAVGDPLAGVAAGAGPAVGEYLLAPFQRVAALGGVGASGRAAAGAAGRGGGDRLGAGDRGRDDRGGQKGGAGIGKSPADRGRPASKLHLACDARGVPLSVALSAANENERGYLLALVDTIPPRRAGWRSRPDALLADRGYDAEHLRDALAQRGIDARIVRRRRPGQGRARDPQARERWPIERTNAWLHNYRRISTRWERRPELYLAFVQLACALIIIRRLQGTF